MLALVFALSVQVNCTVTNVTNPVELVCSDDTVVRISLSDWPELWEGPMLGAVYRGTVQGDELVPLRTKLNPVEQAAIRRRSDQERRRWQRQPTQQPRQP